jgi:hypothetical protein
MDSRRVIRRIGLGFFVGAFFCIAPSDVTAQVVGPPGSEVPIPPKPETDTTKAQVKKDTIKAPFGRMPSPRTADIGPQYEWNREEMYSTGAYTVADLLERVPGTTSFRTGWLMSPKFVAVNGDLQRIRVFYDGIEMDNLDSRSGNLLDLTTIDLFTLENVVIERFANEIRVHLRSWRVERTSPYTRTDIYTGDEDTNIYRGFYGKRFDNGAGLQLGGQEWSTRSNRFGGGGDALSFLARVGIAKKSWSVDAYAVRRNASRVLQPTFGSGLSLPPFEGTHTLGYVRAAAGNQSGGPWVQAIASSMRLAETSDVGNATQIRPDTADSTTKKLQYLAAAGYTSGLVRGSIADRIRAYKGDVHHSPEARLEFGGKYGVVDLFGQKDGEGKRRRLEAAFRVSPVSFIAIAGALSQDSPDDEHNDVLIPDSISFLADSLMPKIKSARIEVGVRVWNPWIFGGFITRDTAVLAAPTVIDTVYHVQPIGKRKGIYGGIRGKLFKDLNAEVALTRWDSAGFYQPRFQSRSELNLNTRWLSKFPSGSFGLKLAAIHEYRGVVRFPTVDGFNATASSNVVSGLIEIRILRGVASYQVRNVFGQIYQNFPDFIMPRSIGIYGLRWEFWN